MPPKPQPSRRTASQAVSNNAIDELSNRLQKGLQLSDAKSKGKQKATTRSPPDPEQLRISAMRTVNAASQRLSELAQAGRKSASAAECASTASKALQELRGLSPGDVDVERAAASVVGKLITLGMHDAARTAISDIHPRVHAFIHGDQRTLETHFFSIPLPSDSTQTDHVLLSLTSTYLLHALTVCYAIGVSPDLLLSTSSLLSWSRIFCESLPPKHTDAIFTRAYTILAKADSYPLRLYALACLTHASPGTVSADALWDQGTKCVATAAKATQVDATSVISSISILIEHAQLRAELLQGRGFVTFCECWTAFAKKTGRLDVLTKIASFMQGGSSSSASSDLSAAGICAVLAQATLVLEEDTVSTDDLDKHIRGATELLIQLASGRGGWIARSHQDDDEKHQHAAAKVQRALERLRRVAMKYLEKSPASDLVRSLLHVIVDALESSLHEKPAADLYTQALDSQFFLARTVLDVRDARTHGAAFDYLSRCERILGCGFSTDSEENQRLGIDKPNYLRCVSGAFHNLGGTLYQSERYGTAVRFLKEACSVGVRALAGRHSDVALSQSGKGKERAVEVEKNDDVWKQLEDQLFRRCELLGVCYSKMGDRKAAHGAFVEAVRHFPYQSSGFTQLCCARGGVFDASPALKQLGVIIDRVTYLGTFELFQEPKQISLVTLASIQRDSPGSSSPSSDHYITDPLVLGAILEHQLVCLDGNRSKEGSSVVMRRVLEDLLGLYSPQRHPLRRARVLVKCLESSYYESSSVNVACPWHDFRQVATEIVDLCAQEDTGHDTSLLTQRDYLNASAHVWAALHVHRCADTQQVRIVQQHTEEACTFLTAMLNNAMHAAANANDGALSPKGANANRAPLKATKQPTSPPAPRRGARKPPSPKAPRKAPAKRVVTRKVEPRAKAGTASTRLRSQHVAVEVQMAPVTPKPQVVERLSSEPASLAVRPQPRVIRTELLVSDVDFENLCAILATLSSLLAFLGLPLVKLRVLNLLRRLCDAHNGTHNDVYITTSVDLAHEYTKLGKVRKANGIYRRVSTALRDTQASDSARIRFLLRSAHSLALSGDVTQSSSTYCEALSLSENACDEDSKAFTTIQRVHKRAARLEEAAIAAEVFAAIQYAKGDIAMSLNGLLQSLRLWNRAMDSLTRLAPSQPSTRASEEDNPFEAPQPTGLSPHDQAKAASVEAPKPRPSFARRAVMNGLEWHICEGLLTTLFTLSRAYFFRGSPREAQYFAEQAQDLASATNAPAMLSQALARIGQIQVCRGQLEEGHESLVKAGAILDAMQSTENANVDRLRADCSRRNAQLQDAQALYEHARVTIEELEKMFGIFDTSGRKSSISQASTGKEVLVPELLASVLSDQIWLLREEGGVRFDALLEAFLALPPSHATKAEESALLAKLTMHNIYERFGLEMFLSSIKESTISIPMGMSSSKLATLSSSVVDILGNLEKAEELFWSALSYASPAGEVLRVREAAMSLAMARLLRTSLGRGQKGDSALAIRLLDYSNAIALRREVLEVISQKFSNQADDLQWPSISLEGTYISRPSQNLLTRARLNNSPLDSDSDEHSSDPATTSYWESLRVKYQSISPDALASPSSQMLNIPSNWTIVHISVTDDHDTLFITRQQGGSSAHEPLVFCVPLRGRRENEGVEDDEHLSYEDAMQELKEILRLSGEGTRSALQISASDVSAREGWWRTRKALDSRMKSLIENIEFCWLGGFKTILHQSPQLSPELRDELRSNFERIFQAILQLRDKPKAKGSSKKSKQGSSNSLLVFDDALLQCFSTLSPKCRDEELEDLIYFILDLYQFHGVPVAPAEVDIAQSVLDLRSVLEDHAQRLAKSKSSPSAAPQDEEHIFLVLDKNVQSIPWESIPSLLGRSVSRIPSLDFLFDRIQLVNLNRNSEDDCVNQSFVDPRRTFYVLNPSGDLVRTEGRLKDWLHDMHEVGWTGEIGRPPSEQQFLDALSRNDLVLYFGHGGGEQYARSHKIRNLNKCAAVMLWGCSSGDLRDMGDFDRVGTPYNYILAGW
ncbi:hypothetical protein HGRIS_011797 [Hohenbuehelia grisea]|uniref:separase n=1 Tax=Hohenbuehelia grisea TaxID=104357 RepID=A0ABR3JWD7_9AGAR